MESRHEGSSNKTSKSVGGIGQGLLRRIRECVDPATEGSRFRDAFLGMNLRVYSTNKPPLLVEISAPTLPYRIKLFVPMFQADDPRIKAIDPNALVSTRLQGKPYKVAFLLVESVVISDLSSFKLEGTLSEEESRDILLNIRDILAWDSHLPA